MIDAEEIAKLPPLKRIKPLALALAYDFIPYAVGLALALIIAAAINQAAHAAAHPDKPVQETAPIAIKPVCTKYLMVTAWVIGKDGEPHLMIALVPACGN